MLPMSSFKEDFGTRIEALRVERGLDVATLAAASGLGDRMVRAIEKGANFTSADALERFAVALDCDVADLFTFPATGFARHELRELLRMTPTAHLDGLRAVMEEYLEPRVSMVGMMMRQRRRR
jgi:transcriptional regulator with XRE-family HTH domain